MLEGEPLACDGRQCFTHFYYITGLGPSILVNDSSARGMQCQDSVVSAVLSTGHTYGMPTHTNYRWLRACTVDSLPFVYTKRMI